MTWFLNMVFKNEIEVKKRKFPKFNTFDDPGKKNSEMIEASKNTQIDESLDYLLKHSKEHDLMKKSSQIREKTSKMVKKSVTVDESLVSPLQYKIRKVIDNDILVVDIGYLEKIRIDRKEFEKFLIQKSIYFQDFFDLIKNLEIKIKKLSENLFNEDEEFASIIKKYLAVTPLQILKNPEEILKFEVVLEYHNKEWLCNNFLISNEFERAKLREIVINKQGEVAVEFQADMSVALEYYHESFCYLVKMMKEGFGEQLTFGFPPGESWDVAKYLTLNALYQTIKINSAEMFWMKYCSFFLDIDYLDLEEAVERYFSIENVPRIDGDLAYDFIYFLMTRGKFSDNNNYINCYEEFSTAFRKEKEKQKYRNFKKALMFEEKKHIISLDEIDMMSNREFELFVSLLFRNLGYRTLTEKHTTDQRINMICEKMGYVWVSMQNALLKVWRTKRSTKWLQVESGTNLIKF